MSRITRRNAARQDLVDVAYYYIRQGSPASARRFRDQAEALFGRPADMPGLGAPYDHDHPALAGLRFLPVTRFKKYLVFYRATPGGIEVVRVLHGARDIQVTLAEGFGIGGQDEAEPGA
jgi:toxin ParE1/3/4